ncbi:MAG: hypothetical protein ACFFA6_17475 [Promethearchaeota archaeon]
MRVKCIGLLPNEQQAKQLGPYYFPGEQAFHGLIVGTEYIVFGLEILGGMPWIQLSLEDENYLFSAPLCLFAIVDGRVSRYWEARVKNGNLLLWPTSFYREYYHDQLFEGFQDVVEDFERVRALIETEASMDLSE